MAKPVLPYEVQVGSFLEARTAEVRLLAGELARSGTHGKLACTCIWWQQYCSSQEAREEQARSTAL